eukprot:76896-Pyramimonas_sp.AAC.1
MPRAPGRWDGVKELQGPRQTTTHQRTLPTGTGSKSSRAQKNDHAPAGRCRAPSTSGAVKTPHSTDEGRRRASWGRGQ